MQPRSNNSIIYLNQSEINSGDFFGIIRLDGLDPMLAWGMGAHTGHTAIAMWIDGVLYVCESTVKSAYWPTNGIQKTPFDQWLQQAYEADFNVVHLPLSAESRANFNATAAIDWFVAVAEGLDYGYNNMLLCWIDVLLDNYPCLPPNYDICLDPETAEWLAGFAYRLDPALANKMFNLALNMRLNTTNMSLPDVLYMAATQRGLSFQTLAMLPEQDAWVYPTGPQMVCDVFVCSMWKHGGLFGNISDEIQCTEQTNWDVYAMNFFDSNYVRPEVCVEADPDSEFCQLMGNYRMSLPGYNSKSIFPDMGNNCPSRNPAYYRPPNC